MRLNRLVTSEALLVILHTETHIVCKLPVGIRRSCAFKITPELDSA